MWSQASSICITGNLLEMQVLRSRPRPTELETPGAGLSQAPSGENPWALLDQFSIAAKQAVNNLKQYKCILRVCRSLSLVWSHWAKIQVSSGHLSFLGP